MANFKVDSPDSGQPISIVAEKAQVTTAGNLVFTNVKNEMCAAFPQGRWRRVWKDAPVLMSAGLDRAVADQPKAESQRSDIGIRGNMKRVLRERLHDGLSGAEMEGLAEELANIARAYAAAMRD